MMNQTKLPIPWYERALAVIFAALLATGMALMTVIMVMLWITWFAVSWPWYLWKAIYRAGHPH